LKIKIGKAYVLQDAIKEKKTHLDLTKNNAMSDH